MFPCKSERIPEKQAPGCNLGSSGGRGSSGEDTAFSSAGAPAAREAAASDRSACCGTGARSPLFWKVLLVIAAVVWGASTFIMKGTLDTLPTFQLLASRFIPAALIMFVLFRRRILANLDRRNLAVGLGMGVIMWIAYGLQTLGLNETTAGKSAFLTGTYCILVPFISYVIAREPITRYNLGAAGLCLGGIALVALDNLTVGIGDALTLIAAFFFALQLAIVSKYGRNLDVNVITFWMFAGMGVLSALSSAVAETHPPLSAWTPQVVASLVFLSLVCTCGCLLIQNTALSRVPPATGSLLLCLESPSGVFFSVIFTGEVLTGRLLVGFAVILCSVVLSETHFSFLGKLVGRGGFAGLRGRRRETEWPADAFESASTADTVNADAA